MTMPYQIIDDLAATLAKLSDAEVLDKLVAVPPLADEAGPCWNDKEYWHQVAYPYAALWSVAAERKLRAAVPLILDRACLGDPGEVMRNLCHALEAIVSQTGRHSRPRVLLHLCRHGPALGTGLHSSWGDCGTRRQSRLWNEHPGILCRRCGRR